MSDQPNPQPNAEVEPAQKRANGGKRRMDHSAAIAAFAKHHGIDTVRAGKRFRARIRANTDVTAKLDKSSKPHVKNAQYDSHSVVVLRTIFPEVPAFKRAKS